MSSAHSDVQKHAHADATIALIQGLSHSDGAIVQGCARALAKRADPQATEPLCKAAKHEDYGPRDAAIEALGALDDDRARQTLREIIATGPSSEEALKALAKQGREHAIDIVVVSLTASDTERAPWAAVEAFADVAEEDDVERLLSTCEEACAGRRGFLARIFSRAQSDGLKQSQYILHALAKVNCAKAVSLLARAVKHPDSDVRWPAAEALGRTSDPAAVDPLIAATRDESGLVRRTAAESLGELQDGRAFPVLSKLLADADEEMRTTALIALGNLGDPRAFESLTSALKDEHYGTRQAAARALGSFGDRRAVDALIDALNDDNWLVRRLAAASLAELGDPCAVNPILSAFPSGAAPALRKLGFADKDVLLARLVDALGSGSIYADSDTLEALGELGDIRAVPHLIKVLTGNERSSIRMDAIAALAQLEAESAAPAILSALNDDEDTVRTAATEALAALDHLPGAWPTDKPTDGESGAARCPRCGAGVVFGSSDTASCPGCGLAIIDFCGNKERRIASASGDPLAPPDEELAHRLVEMQQKQIACLRNENPGADKVKAEIRKIGESIGAEGGTYRMKRLGYRVQALGGDLSLLVYSWRDICGWQP